LGILLVHAKRQLIQHAASHEKILPPDLFI